MDGTIKNRDVLCHSLIILRHFGLLAYLRCVRAILRAYVRGESCTFLATLYGSHAKHRM